MELGFIGIGNMGAPMSANLARAGHDVTGFDISSFNAEGMSSAASHGFVTCDAGWMMHIGLNFD